MYVIIGLVNGLLPNWWQAIIWTNVNFVIIFLEKLYYKEIWLYLSSGLNGFE